MLGGTAKDRNLFKYHIKDNKLLKMDTYCFIRFANALGILWQISRRYVCAVSQRVMKRRPWPRIHIKRLMLDLLLGYPARKVYFGGFTFISIFL